MVRSVADPVVGAVGCPMLLVDAEHAIVAAGDEQARVTRVGAEPLDDFLGRTEGCEWRIVVGWKLIHSEHRSA